jgi:D-alanyl-D-alanine carboxypeptidase/D-alanyl-D-alanine-endopeptidase (penicillin-binding protein 4)
MSRSVTPSLLLTLTLAGGAAAAPPDAPPDPLGKFAPTSITPTAPAGTPAERQKWLAGQIEAALADPALSGAKVGVAIVDVESGRPVYARNDTSLFNPASNVKLFTTAGALALLGPEYRWKTVVYADQPVGPGGELKGRLYVKGHGDPTLVVEDLWRIVADLWAAGLRKVSGELVVDDTFFDDVRLGPGFQQKQEDQAFRAPNGALSLNYNAVGVHVLPGPSDGAPARVVIDPATPYFVVTNEARTGSGRTSITVETKEAPGHTLITVRGRIRHGDPGVVQTRRVAHPDLYTAYAFRELCVRRGIKMGAGPIGRAETPNGVRALAAHYSQPLGIAVRDVNKLSNNFMAEQILKTVGAETGGRPGTWQKGVDGIAGFLEKIGIARTDYKMTNGSGLYDSNRFSPVQAVTLLRTAYRDFRFASDFIGSLALAGADGTIGHRMEGGLAERYVRAKTGTLAGISCLAGYAGAPAHAPLAFAIFMNDLPDPATQKARRAQDQIAEALVAYLLAK